MNATCMLCGTALHRLLSVQYRLCMECRRFPPSGAPRRDECDEQIIMVAAAAFPATVIDAKVTDCP